MFKKIIVVGLALAFLSACGQVEAQNNLTDQYFSEGEEYLEVSRGRGLGLRVEDDKFYHFREMGGSYYRFYFQLAEIEKDSFGQLVQFVYEEDEVDVENWNRFYFYNGNGRPESFSSVVLKNELFYFIPVDDQAFIFLRNNELGQSLIEKFEGISTDQITGYGRTDENSPYAETFDTFWQEEAGFIFILKE